MTPLTSVVNFSSLTSKDVEEDSILTSWRLIAVSSSLPAINLTFTVAVSKLLASNTMSPTFCPSSTLDTSPFVLNSLSSLSSFGALVTPSTVISVTYLEADVLVAFTVIVL